ncbi:S66 peptidase family protein [Maribacter aurantiacus]|uniref:LD-carboxypeptidase n=1 Tax=Maribacter aurantiacus TaxID=1882343 RepID=A0A5R8M8B8_9FLAO|nr:LD-carboxypeptidase [Maribacter aurantiacus]TLF45803.1 LD-carboxypeptidase [Maribacter aurantiacus]
MLPRRKFLTAALSLSVYQLVYGKEFPKTGKSVKLTGKLYPKPLKKGGTIGLIAPGYRFSEETLTKAKSVLRKMGYIVYCTERLSKPYGYFSNTDEERATDLNHMFENKVVDGILCIRGGYGCTRIMHLIDYGVIASNPKALIGFSDVTALLNGIHQMTGLITFHGPVGSTLDDGYSQKALIDIVKKPKENRVIRNAKLTKEQLIDAEYERYTINPGEAKGELCGGSLTLINALIGTPHEIDFTDKIVCIEDVEESPYRIDRMLTQLIEGKTFKKASGILFGVCKGCNTSNNPNSFTLKEVILDRIKPLEIPAAYGFSFGHVEQNFTFPIGMEAYFDADRLKLKIIQKPVTK